jgi:hypothetical protein
MSKTKSPPETGGSLMQEFKDELEQYEGLVSVLGLLFGLVVIGAIVLWA